ncbi:MAG: decarboxylase [Rhodobacteraceae bacterium CG17_big_fil_post_rev_8_21_14_2_50_63_15]|nr:malonyl-CoA decarboxylase [Roseovarius sp.]PIV78863.1 MAG: decarboxylase [Rhodobacteraceae bacterium CG17_big_fil_post_rev_8_21_14_2_50_63_15]
MSMLADLLATVFERRYRGAEAADRHNRSIEDMCHDLLGGSGEVSGMALARLILDSYAAKQDAEKVAFFSFLTNRMGVDPEAVRHTLEAYETAPDRATYRDFLAASEPPRQEVARRLNQVPGATAQLVAMRADLLRLSRDTPALAVLDLDFKHLFASWFNRGFLVLRPINWSSPADILEKIIAYEAVHAIDSWEDLRRRLAPQDRRCFGFFHPAMPDEPLIFVEVALSRGIPGTIHDVLSEDRAVIGAHQADTAVFYSISNCQEGLAGISFGNSLIKQVVADLSQELPGLKTFVTLSPIPALIRWLAENGALLPKEPEARRALTAVFLLEAKRPDGTPYDPVARFHLGNGASIHAIHADADLSSNGQTQSGGVMVNYLYDLARISQNHERFVGSGRIAASPEVKALAAAGKRTD